MIRFPLFLFNYSNRQLHGVFEATCDADWEIDPTGRWCDLQNYCTSLQSGQGNQSRAIQSAVACAGWCKPGQKYTNYPCQVQVKRISSPSPLDYK